MPDNPNLVLQVKNLTKSFGEIKALDGVQLEVKKGEVLALLGENGAGKSTFMKILMGLLQPDDGEIKLDGIEIKNYSVHEILTKGISMIHQEILAVPELTISQNIFLGKEKHEYGWLKEAENKQKASEILESLGLKIDVNTKIKKLSIAQQQIVEMAKAISNDAKVIIMDEPTSALSEKETEALFKIILELKSNSVSIIYISHKLEEIFKIADRITVLRDGKYISTVQKDAIDQNSLIKLMVGREIENLFPTAHCKIGKTIFSVSNLTQKGKFKNISFELRQGEILGIAGLMGAGRTEIVRAIFGLNKKEHGEIIIDGIKIEINSPKEAIKYGIGYVGEDRKAEGFIPKLSVKNNLSLNNLSQYSNKWFIDDNLESVDATKISEILKIKSAKIHEKLINLSGGNQQKVVIGKVLLANPKVIILDEPTRGIDVGAKFEIYKLIRELTEKGLAVIMISSELPEIIGMSDRILVISQGTQKTILNKNEASQENIMKYAVH